MKNVEINVKIKGAQNDLDHIVSALKGVSGAAGQATPNLTALEAKIASLEKQIAALKKRNEEAANSFSGFHQQVSAHINAPVDSAVQSLATWLDGLGKAPAVLAGVGVGVALLAEKTFELVASQASAAKGTINFADRLGISTGAALKLQVGAKLAGVDVGVLEASTRLLASALEDSSGAGAKASKALDKLQVSAYDNQGNLREMGSVLLDVLASLGKIPSVSERAFLAQQLLGRGAKEIQPLLKNLEDINKATEALGVGLDDNITKNLANADTEIQKMDAAWERFKKNLAAGVAPVVIPIVTKIADIAAGKGGLVAPGNKAGQFALSALGPLAEIANLASYIPELTNAKPAPSSLLTIGEGKPFVSDADQAKSKQLAEQFKKDRSQDIDAQKKRLEQVKKDVSDAAAALQSGAIADPKDFADKKNKYASLLTDQKNLEASIKAAEEFPNKLKELETLLGGSVAKFRADVAKAFNVDAKKGSAVEAYFQNLLGDSVPAGAKAILDAEAKANELLGALGHGFDAKVVEVFSSARAAETSKIIAENRKYIAESVKTNGEQLGRDFENNSKEFAEDLKEYTEDYKRKADTAKEALKIYSQNDQRKLISATDIRIKTRDALATPGGEAQTANADYKDRLKLANDVFDIEKKRVDAIINSFAPEEERETAQLDLVKARAKYEEDSDKAKEERENALLELRKKNLDDYRNYSNGIFDALTSGNVGKGLTDYFRGQLKDQGRVVFGNLTQGIIGEGVKSLGGVGAKTGLGSILNGTVFDPRNNGANAPVEKNTSALDRLTASINSLLVSKGSGGVGLGGVGTGSGSLGTFASDLSGFTGTGTLSDQSVDDSGNLLNSGGSGGATDGEGNPLFTASAVAGKGPSTLANFLKGAAGVVPSKDGGGLFSAFGKDSDASASEKFGNAVSSVGALAAAAGGVISGIQQGGARGIATSVGSALGAAALIPGPQQPFIAAAGIITGLVKGFLGSSKEERALQIDKEISRAKYVDPTPVSVSIGSNGNQIDRDFRGRIRTLNTTPDISTYNQINSIDPFNIAKLISTTQRVVNGAPTIIVQTPVTVSTMDAKSFQDNSGKIGDALTTAIQNGHRVGGDIQRLVSPR